MKTETSLLAPPEVFMPVNALPAKPAAVAAAPAREHYYWIDWLRFLAAAAVMLEHICAHNHMAWFGLPEAMRTPWRFAVLIPTRFGRESVILFFVVSGFLIGGRTIRRVREGTFDLRAYALDRATRIYVPLVPALALTLALSPVCGVQIWPEMYPGHLLALQGLCMPPLYLNTPLWTLSYETWFYVLAGAAAVLAGPGGRGKWGAFVVAAVSLGLFVQLVPTYLFCWLLGAFAYGLTEAVRSRRVGLGWMAAAVALAGCASYQVANGVLPVDPAWKAYVPRPEACEMVLAAGLSMLVACLAGAAPVSWAARGIERLGTRLAAFSYTLYLVHYPVMYYLAVRWPRLGGFADGRVAVRLVLCTTAAWVMYALFEAHTGRVRRWLQGRL